MVDDRGRKDRRLKRGGVWGGLRRPSGAVEGLIEVHGVVFLHWVRQWDERPEGVDSLPFSARQTAKLTGLTESQVRSAKEACIKLGYIRVFGAKNQQRMVVNPPEYLPPMLG